MANKASDEEKRLVDLSAKAQCVQAKKYCQIAHADFLHNGTLKAQHARASLMFSKNISGELPYLSLVL